MTGRPLKLVFRAYEIDGEQAPNRCEMCDAAVPDDGARREHMEETRHRRCQLCSEYVPVGGYYAHCMEKHKWDRWNEHQVAYSDSQDITEAKPWAAAERERLRKGLTGKR